MKARFPFAAFVFLVVTVAANGCGEDATEPDYTSSQSGRNRVVMIGIDGAEWDVMRPMMERGELPHLSALAQRGASGHLINPGPQVSPAVWTTFATGHFGRAHGILDFTFPFDDSEQKRPVRSTMRRVPAIWNVASTHGVSVGAVGYFVSHPAEEVNGFMVTDRAPVDAEGAVYPEGLLAGQSDELLDVYTSPGKEKVLARFFPWGYDPDAAGDPDDPEREEARAVADRVDQRILTDEYLRRASLGLAGHDVDLFIGYLRLVDVVSHAAWRFFDARDFEDKPSERNRERLGDLVPETYRYADEYVGQLMDIIGEEANYIIVSDHGFGSATGPFAPKHGDEILTGNHRPNGVLIAAGPDIRPGTFNDLSILEIMPALAALLGLPISDELPGRLPRELLADGVLESRPPEFVARYEGRWRTAAGDEATDAAAEREEMESLKGLGYIGGDVEMAASGDASEYDFWAASRDLVISHLTGEALYYLLQGDLAAAKDVVRLAENNDSPVGLDLARRVRSKQRTLNREMPEPLDHAEAFDAFYDWANGR